MDAIIQGLWVGPELSVMEQLSITSFLRHGHDYHLYVYGDVKHVPEGTVIRDGNEILPASMIFQYKDRKSYSGFSNYFRYKLLLEKGGWWVDTDMVCHKPFAFEQAYVFSSELLRGKELINVGAIKAPAASDVMAYAWQACQAKNAKEVVWGETGPRLMAEAVERFALGAYVKPPKVFCPIGFRAWEELLDPTIVWAFDKTTYGIHLWNEMWRQDDRGKDHRYHRDCLYEQLKQRYLRG